MVALKRHYRVTFPARATSRYPTWYSSHCATGWFHTPPRRLDLQSQHRLATALGHSMPDSHRRFLGGLALSFSCGDFFFVHAGVRPGVPLQEQSQNDLLWIREDFLLHEEDFGKVVVHGHTPAREPDIRPNRINIDTGAYATGRLTCLVLEGHQVSFL